MRADSGAEIIAFPTAELPVRDAVPRSGWDLLAATIRNPIEALPPEVYDCGLVRSTVFGTTLVHVTDPELVQRLLVSESDALEKSPAIRRALGPALGNGLLTSDGAHWRWQRRAVAEPFRPDGIAEFIPQMNAAALDGCARLATIAGGGAPVDCGREMMRITFDIIVATMLSGRDMIDVDRVATGAADYLRQTRWALALSMLHAPPWLPYPGRRRGQRAAAYLRGAVGAVVATRRASGRAHPDLVERLLAARDPETGSRMTDAEIIDNLLTFVAAGHETTALGLAWTMDLLSRHPKAQADIVAEIDQVTRGNRIAAADLERLALTRQAFQEAMRLYPPAPLISRVARRSVRLGRDIFAAGTRFVVPVYAVHRHRVLWREPERFDPARFSPERSASRHRFAFMPFGAGPRVCIGAGFATTEAVVILASLLQRFRFEPVSADAPAARMEITLRPAGTLSLRAVPRRALRL